MEERPTLLEPLIEHIEAFGKTSLALIKLKSTDKAVDIAANFVLRLFAFISILLFMLLASIGLALWLGEMFVHIWYGFFMVAGAYALIGLVLYLLAHEWIKKIIKNSMIAQIFNL